MNQKEIKKAKIYLDRYVERVETIIDGNGQSITAHFVDGGQKLFRSLDHIEEWVREKRFRDR